LRVALQGLEAQGDLVAKKFNDDIGKSFADNLTAVLDKTKSLSEGFKDLEKSIVHMLNEAAANEIKSYLFGKGGGLSGIGGFLASLFAGNAGGSSANASWAAMLAAGTSTFASGTSFAPGGWAMVGERGPEIVNLPRGAQVIPNHELVVRREARSGTTVVQQITVMPGATRQSGAQQANQAARALMASERVR